MLEEFIISIISHNLYKYDLYNTYFEFYFFKFIFQTKNIIIYFTMFASLHPGFARLAGGGGGGSGGSREVVVVRPGARVRAHGEAEAEEDHQQEEAAAAHHGQEHQRGHTLQHLCVDMCRYV